jgi:hypothetical protein
MTKTIISFPCCGLDLTLDNHFGAIICQNGSFTFEERLFYVSANDIQVHTFVRLFCLFFGYFFSSIFSYNTSVYTDKLFMEQTDKTENNKKRAIMALKSLTCIKVPGPRSILNQRLLFEQTR